MFFLFCICMKCLPLEIFNNQSPAMQPFNQLTNNFRFLYVTYFPHQNIVYLIHFVIVAQLVEVKSLKCKIMIAYLKCDAGFIGDYTTSLIFCNLLKYVIAQYDLRNLNLQSLLLIN